uniref:alpha-amylase family glycosyl hydrolase n=1 Tax=Prevotella sp. TaxID=59823 RepID=UPI0040285ED9
MKEKVLIYQVLPRLFGNKNTNRKENGTIEENGCGKLNHFNDTILARIHDMGFTHIWYTGVIRHATQTNYSSYGIPTQHAEVVKGKAGSPYAITDYYDIDPDLAENVSMRMAEWESLIERTHKAGMKVIMDFVPNHVAREYHSICKPAGVRDLGEDDDKNMHFSTKNNFYYAWGDLDLNDVRQSKPEFKAYAEKDAAIYELYVESPARATGNDRFDNRPGCNDWYETVKLNYGIDYCDAGGRSYHYEPVPSTWGKMTDILLYWASKGVDGFRCDMAEMVPTAFWSYATQILKSRYPEIIVIGEVYDPSQYRNYVKAGFDYLYDKVGMYDCLRGVIRGKRPASSITHEWQEVDDIRDHMLYFLENHDEQRIASDFFCGDAMKAIPAAAMSLFFQKNPFMLYSGQEFGERGMDKEGFSGVDGRTTIFDYWSPVTLAQAYQHALPKTANKTGAGRKTDGLTPEQKYLAATYRQMLRLANEEKAIREGDTFDLMYVNPGSDHFDPRTNFAFLRKKEEEVLLVVLNFSIDARELGVCIPGHAFDFLHLPEEEVSVTELWSGGRRKVELKKDGIFPVSIEANGVRIYKFNVKMEESEFILNEHHKEEFPPAHTAEHLLNQLMVRMFGCERSRNAHIERKKSKMTFVIDHKPSRQEEKEIEAEMNRLIEADMPVTYEFVDRDHIPADVKLDRLPEDASETLRLVRIGDYDVCPCIGKHVRSTAQIGKFVMLGTNWDEASHSLRIRFKIVQ